MPNQDLLSRLKKARIVQVLVVYFGASWVVLQIAEILQEAFALPSWVLPFTILLLQLIHPVNIAVERAKEVGQLNVKGALDYPQYVIGAEVAEIVLGFVKIIPHSVTIFSFSLVRRTRHL